MSMNYTFAACEAWPMANASAIVATINWSLCNAVNAAARRASGCSIRSVAEAAAKIALFFYKNTNSLNPNEKEA